MDPMGYVPLISIVPGCFHGSTLLQVRDLKALLKAELPAP